MLACAKPKDLEKSQCLLDKAKTFAATRPYTDCKVLCPTLIDAYNLALEKSGKSLKCGDVFDDETIE